MEHYDISLRRTGLSISDRLVAARRLDTPGLTFVDGGRPGRFYRRAAVELRLRATTLVVSGGAEDLTALLAAETAAVAMVVQGHGFFPDSVSGLREAVRQLVRAQRRVIVEARDFFDGWLADPEHALEVVLTAAEAGAETVLLHDTAGRLWPDQIGEIVETVAETGVPLGFGCHGGDFVAKQQFAAEAGAGLLQRSYAVVRGGLDRAVSPSVHSAETGIAPVPCPRLEQTVSAQKAIGGVR